VPGAVRLLAVRSVRGARAGAEPDVGERGPGRGSAMKSSEEFRKLIAELKKTHDELNQTRDLGVRSLRLAIEWSTRWGDLEKFIEAYDFDGKIKADIREEMGRLATSRWNDAKGDWEKIPDAGAKP